MGAGCIGLALLGSPIGTRLGLLSFARFFPNLVVVRLGVIAAQVFFLWLVGFCLKVHVTGPRGSGSLPVITCWAALGPCALCGRGAQRLVSLLCQVVFGMRSCNLGQSLCRVGCK